MAACSSESSDDDDDSGGTTLTVTGGTGGGTTSTGGNTTTGGTGGTSSGSGSGACESGPLSAPIAGCSPSPPPSTGDFHQDCVDRINQFRWECQCLPPLERWTDGEACADEHAEYDSTRSAHAGFQDNICSPRGNAQNECPGWGSVGQVLNGCLQMMWDEGPGQPFSEHGHYINMSSTSYSRKNPRADR